MTTKHTPNDYFTLPLELWSYRDLTDALGIPKCCELLGTSPRSMYSTRSNPIVSAKRMQVLIDAVRANEDEMRRKLVVIRNTQAQRTPAA